MRLSLRFVLVVLCALFVMGAAQTLTDLQRIEQAEVLLAPLEGRLTPRGVANLLNGGPRLW